MEEVEYMLYVTDGAAYGVAVGEPLNGVVHVDAAADGRILAGEGDMQRVAGRRLSQMHERVEQADKDRELYHHGEAPQSGIDFVLLVERHGGFALLRAIIGVLLLDFRHERLESLHRFGVSELRDI